MVLTRILTGTGSVILKETILLQQVQLLSATTVLTVSAATILVLALVMAAWLLGYNHKEKA